MTLSLSEKLEILFAQTNFCPICGGSLTLIGNGLVGKECGLKCGIVSFTDGDCTDGVTACFQPAEKIFDDYLSPSPKEKQ